jgi:hypothetical protein
MGLPYSRWANHACMAPRAAVESSGYRVVVQGSCYTMWIPYRIEIYAYQDEYNQKMDYRILRKVECKKEVCIVYGFVGGWQLTMYVQLSFLLFSALELAGIFIFSSSIG